MATNIVIPDTVLKRLNDLHKEVRIKFWEQLGRLTAKKENPWGQASVIRYLRLEESSIKKLAHYKCGVRSADCGIFKNII